VEEARLGDLLDLRYPRTARSITPASRRYVGLLVQQGASWPSPGGVDGDRRPPERHTAGVRRSPVPGSGRVTPSFLVAASPGHGRDRPTQQSEDEIEARACVGVSENARASVRRSRIGAAFGKVPPGRYRDGHPSPG
jgi:hypothetical protein